MTESTPPKSPGIFETMRAGYAERKRRAGNLELRRSEQIELWFNTKAELREAKSRLRDAVSRQMHEELLAKLRELVVMWGEMFDDADAGLKFINGERDRRSTDQRALSDLDGFR